MAEAKDIFKKFDESWSDKVSSIEKWQDRMQALKDLSDAANVPKILATSNYLPGKF